MNSPKDSVDSDGPLGQDDLLDHLIGELLLAVERGEPTPLNRFVEQHPNLADDLREFWTNHLAVSGQERESVGENTIARFDGASANDETTLLGPGGVEASDRPNSGSAFSPRDSSVSAASSTRGPTVRHFELFEELGRGGMGVVYRGRDPQLGQDVAIKMLLSSISNDPLAVQRFYSEAQAAAQLSHPGIVPVFEVGEEQGVHYYAMALVEGESLAKRIDTSGPLTPRDAALIVREAAAAVEHANQAGVIHRDIKPSNLILDSENRPKLVDFGLAKRTDSTVDLTMTGQILGTLCYMAPEQAAGRNKQIGPATDVYGLGAVLFTALVGTPPFEGESQAELIVKVLTAEAPIGRMTRRDANLASICRKCLEKEPENRYASAAELAADLEAYLQGDPVSANEGLGQRFRRWTRQQPALAVHWLGLGGIELLRHTKRLWDGDTSHDAWISLLLAIWAVACLAAQRLLDRYGESSRIAWVAVDLVLLTTVLSVTPTPHGPLLATYPMAIVFCALLYRVRLVVVTTIGSIIGYIVLTVTRPWDGPMHHHLLFVLTLAIVGLVIGAHLRRLRLLEEVYKSR